MDNEVIFSKEEVLKIALYYAVNRLVSYVRLSDQGWLQRTTNGEDDIHGAILNGLLDVAKEAEYPEYVLPEVDKALAKVGL